VKSVKFENVTLVSRGFGPVSLEFVGGEMTLLCGLSGSGKSTLCQLLCGRQVPSHGGILGRESFPIGYVAHDFESQLIGSTVREELSLGNEVDWETWSEALADLVTPLVAQSSCDPHDLAASEQQALLLCGLVRSGARFLVLDESLSLLDPLKRHRFMKVLRTLRSSGLGFLLVSHDPGLLPHVDRVVVLEKGGVLYDGSPDDVTSRALESAGFQAQGVQIDQPPIVELPTQKGAHLDGEDFLLTGGPPELRLGPGESLALAGFAGSGKSRVLGALFGLRDYLCWSQIPAGLSASLLRQHVAPSFWRPNVLLEWEASLECFQPLAGAFKDALFRAIDPGWHAMAPHQLSNGQLRFFGILCLMAQNPDVLFLDQPFQGLDGPLRVRLGVCLSAFLGAAGRLILTTHDPALVSRLGGRGIWLEDGQAVWQGDTSGPAWSEFLDRLQARVQ
jgi:energy-coupling factor transporter ATP-binding protein EcfA2